MSRLWHILCFGLLAMVISVSAGAQMIKDPTHWTYESKKVSEGEYELTFKVALDKSWHIWSINVGGDGFQVVPAFKFDKKVKLNGALKESGKKITETMEGVEGKVSYYSSNVTYTQLVKASAGTTISGKHEYQVCNDNMCLPPKTLQFSFQLN